MQLEPLSTREGLQWRQEEVNNVSSPVQAARLQREGWDSAWEKVTYSVGYGGLYVHRASAR